jgi:hypothetical protein
MFFFLLHVNVILLLCYWVEEYCGDG